MEEDDVNKNVKQKAKKIQNFLSVTETLRNIRRIFYVEFFEIG